jgi:hypothetical protein
VKLESKTLIFNKLVKLESKYPINYTNKMFRSFLPWAGIVPISHQARTFPFLISCSFSVAWDGPRRPSRPASLRLRAKLDARQTTPCSASTAASQICNVLVRVRDGHMPDGAVSWRSPRRPRSSKAFPRFYHVPMSCISV